MRSDGSVTGPGLEEQMEQVFRNLLGTPGAAGAGFGHVARLTTYVRDYQPELLRRRGPPDS